MKITNKNLMFLLFVFFIAECSGSSGGGGNNTVSNPLSACEMNNSGTYNKTVSSKVTFCGTCTDNCKINLTLPEYGKYRLTMKAGSASGYCSNQPISATYYLENTAAVVDKIQFLSGNFADIANDPALETVYEYSNHKLNSTLIISPLFASSWSCVYAGTGISAGWSDYTEVPYQITAELVALQPTVIQTAAPWTKPVDATGIAPLTGSISLSFLDPVEMSPKAYVFWGSNNQLNMNVYNGNDLAPQWTTIRTYQTNVAPATMPSGNLTYDPFYYFYNPSYHPVVFNGKLYAAGYSIPSSLFSMLFVYNGNDAAPAWTNLITMAYDPTDAGIVMPVVFNSQFYLVRMLTVSNFNRYRMYVYNGNDLAPAVTEVGSSVTHDSTINNTANNITSNNLKLIVANAKLYAFWLAKDPLNTNNYLVHGAVYNGNDAAPAWTSVDGASGTLNHDPGQGAYGLDATSIGNQVYLSWHEGQYGISWHSEILEYNANEIAPVFNYLNMANDIPQALDLSLVKGAAPNLEVTYLEYADLQGSYGVKKQVRVKSYVSGTGWSFDDGGGVNGLNYFGGNGGYSSLLYYNLKLYGFWAEGRNPDNSALSLDLNFGVHN